MHYQTAVITDDFRQPQPYEVRADRPRPFNYGHATCIGVFLIVVGSLSILFNTVDLFIGSHTAVHYKHTDETLSQRSLGVAGHGIWCGAMVRTIMIVI